MPYHNIMVNLSTAGSSEAHAQEVGAVDAAFLDEAFQRLRLQ